MNERIKKLIAQSTTAVDPHDREWVFSRFDKEKFAELIVRECAEKFAAEPDKPFYGRHVSYHILKHFGVAE